MRYETINGWTKEKMISHIKANFKGKSTVKEDSDICLYRGPEGRQCAVGMFIPDYAYDEDYENKVVSATQLERVWPFLPLLPENMGSLQSVHDMSKPENTLVDMISWINYNVKDDVK